jgi:hypothetical protein
MRVKSAFEDRSALERRRTGPSDVEDRCGLRSRPGLPLGFGATIVLLILSVDFKQDFFFLLDRGYPGRSPVDGGVPISPERSDGPASPLPLPIRPPVGATAVAV